MALSFIRDFSERDSDVDNTSEELDGGLTVALFVFSGSGTGSIRFASWGQGGCELVDIQNCLCARNLDIPMNVLFYFKMSLAQCCGYTHGFVRSNKVFCALCTLNEQQRLIHAFNGSGTSHKEEIKT